jgi:hypothetical protein
VIVDDWGPPAGFTVVEGTVRRANGTPANLIFLSLTQCTNPLVDFLGSTTTDNQGRYRIEGQLGPVGLLPRVDADTLRDRCVLLTGPPPLPLDSVEVRFWRDRAAVVPLVVNLQFPS